MRSPRTLHALCTAAALVLLAVIARLAASADDWIVATPESQGLSHTALDTLRDGLAQHGTRALVVVRHDRIVYEWYAPGHTATEKQGTASLAKATVGGLSLAVALTDHLIASLDDPVAKYVPQWQGDARRSRITLRQLGSHTSGMDDAEANDLPHDKLTGWPGDFWKRLPPPRDPFTLARDETPLVYESGTRLSYSNPGIAMLAYAVTAAMKDRPQHDIRGLLQERIMRPIGVTDEEWSVGYGQTFTVDGLPLVATWGGAAYTPRAAARIGRLVLHRGNWAGRQLLSPDSIRLVTADAGTPGHGAMGWWSNEEGVDPKLPRDAFWGSGAGHQTLMVIPSLDIVAIRNGDRIAESANDPASFHGPVSRYLSGPLMAALIDHPAPAAPYAKSSKREQPTSSSTASTNAATQRGRVTSTNAAASSTTPAAVPAPRSPTTPRCTDTCGARFSRKAAIPAAHGFKAASASTTPPKPGAPGPRSISPTTGTSAPATPAACRPNGSAQTAAPSTWSSPATTRSQSVVESCAKEHSGRSTRADVRFAICRPADAGSGFVCR